MADEQTQAAGGEAAAATEEASLLDVITAETRRSPQDEDYGVV